MFLWSTLLKVLREEHEHNMNSIAQRKGRPFEVQHEGWFWSLFSLSFGLSFKGAFGCEATRSKSLGRILL